jgi:hypothetical protein
MAFDCPGPLIACASFGRGQHLRRGPARPSAAAPMDGQTPSGYPNRRAGPVAVRVGPSSYESGSPRQAKGDEDNDGNAPVLLPGL